MEVYIKNNKLYTKIYRKETDRQNVLNINSEHPISLKNSIYLLDKHISTVEKEKNVKGKSKGKAKTNSIPLTLTYNHFCPNINKVIQKQWNFSK